MSSLILSSSIFCHSLQNFNPVASMPITPTSTIILFIVGLSILYSIKLVPKLKMIANKMHKINNSFFIFTSCHFGLCLLIVTIYINTHLGVAKIRGFSTKIMYYINIILPYFQVLFTSHIQKMVYGFDNILFPSLHMVSHC